MWETDTGLPVILSDITGNKVKGETIHLHFELVATKKVIVRTLDEVQKFTKI
jgi:hypothetical protein